jgi:hypothetical protein
MLNEVALSRAHLLLRSGQLVRARAEVDNVLARLNYPAKKDAPGVSSALHVGARVALAQKDFDTADRWATDSGALAARQARDPQSSADVGQAAFHRSQAQLGLGRADQARLHAERAATALRAGFGAEHPETRAAFEQLAALASASGR